MYGEWEPRETYCVDEQSVHVKYAGPDCGETGMEVSFMKDELGLDKLGLPLL
tara:strand:- start:435 stop:590 length:156 start_codon:yes stop_codon:yes gene_type:complete